MALVLWLPIPKSLKTTVCQVSCNKVATFLCYFDKNVGAHEKGRVETGREGKEKLDQESFNLDVAAHVK